MEERRAGKLLLLSIGSVLLMFLARTILPAAEQPFLIIGAIGFMGLIYMNVPDGYGHLDFKAGVAVGGAMAILVYEIVMQVARLLAEVT